MEIIQYIESLLEIQDDVHLTMSQVDGHGSLANSLADPIGVHSRGVPFYLLVSQLCKNFQQWS